MHKKLLSSILLLICKKKKERKKCQIPLCPPPINLTKNSLKSELHSKTKMRARANNLVLGSQPINVKVRGFCLLLIR